MRKSIQAYLIWWSVQLDEMYLKKYLKGSNTGNEAKSSVCIVVVGFFSTASGMGELARGSYRLLKSSGFEVVAMDLSREFGQVDFDPNIDFASIPKDGKGLILLYVNGGETLFSLRKLGVIKRQGWRVIGVWAWELPFFPQAWKKSTKALDEIWTCSNFSLKALESSELDISVNHVRPYIAECPTKPETDFRRILPHNKFVFLTMCDSRSSVTRKNPLGTIDAFKIAFPIDQDVQLIVKTRNFHVNSPEWKMISEAISGHSNIIWIDETYSHDKYCSLLSQIDCFVSLHRSEGFGLPMAEAMMLGIPVIATNWSANLDFMDETTSLLVDFDLIPVVDAQNIYQRGKGVWAEPNIGQAAKYLVKLKSDQELHAKLSSSSKIRVAKYFDRGKVIEEMKYRFDFLANEQRLF